MKQIDLDQVENIGDLILQWQAAGVFGGGMIGEAVKIYQEALKNNSTILVGLAGAMVPGGMREVICNGIRSGKIHALTTTGANITHDLIEAFGGGHAKNVQYADDSELLDRGIDRVYDSFVKAGSFGTFEERIKELLTELMGEETQHILSTSELMRFIGEKIDDHNSIVKTAFEYNVPIFIPAISDSVLGLQIWLYSQFNNLIIDSTKDIEFIQDVYHERERSCAVLLGGGVPKNYTLQAALMASRHYSYAIQITMDRVETGGLSGASLKEAISWGKLEKSAKVCTVVSDITIALPIIFKALDQLKSQ